MVYTGDEWYKRDAASEGEGEEETAARTVHSQRWCGDGAVIVR